MFLLAERSGAMLFCRTQSKRAVLGKLKLYINHCPSTAGFEERSALRSGRKSIMPKIIPPTFITQTEEALDKGYDPKVARGLLRFVKPYTGQMLIALFFMILVSAASVSGPYFVNLAIDNGITPKDPVALKNIV